MKMMCNSKDLFESKGQFNPIIITFQRYYSSAHTDILVF